MKTGIIIQARMGSTRLPGKVMMDLGGKPVLQRVIERAKGVSGVDTIVLATTFKPEDMALCDLATTLDIPYYRGSVDNVLDRYFNAAALFQLDTICRVTADCPLLDPDVSSLVLDTFKHGHWDYVSNVHPPTYPDGLDFEVFSWDVLNTIRSSASKPYELEHVTPAVWQRPSTFSLQNVWADADYSENRWTVDTLDDLVWVQTVYDQLGSTFQWKDVLSVSPHTLPRVIRL